MNLLIPILLVKNCKITITRTRHLKIWHDHSDISGHSHLLVLVASVYDPALYYTSEEMKQKGVVIDVQTTIEEPEIHILARSGNSLDDQSMFSQCRRECLSDITSTLYTKDKIPIQDVVRSFHGDGPAQQFESGNKIGGHYCCVGCEAHASRFDDFAYCFRAHHLSLKERQAFILEGEAWKDKHINPLSKLKVAALQSELVKRGVAITGKKKDELQDKLDDLQRGIANVPAILQQTPETSLESLGLGTYEVFPSEPLHDLKGHFQHIIDETMKTAPSAVQGIVQQIKDTILNKSTLRCCDY